uniref:HTH cro/C1-type domain-containing protein n=1 Tax=Glossina pallidipes TaxID=7398 RepID=A0A1A9ZEC7_GLOPL
MSFVGGYTIRNNLGMRYKWSELVRHRMKERGVTRERIANMLGKTPGAVGHWLNGRREPSLTDIASIFQILGLSSVVLHGTDCIGTLRYKKYLQYLIHIVSFIPLTHQKATRRARRWGSRLITLIYNEPSALRKALKRAEPLPRYNARSRRQKRRRAEEVDNGLVISRIDTALGLKPEKQQYPS